MSKVYRSETDQEELLCPSWCVVWQTVQSGSTDLLRNRCTCLPFGSCEHILHDCFLHHQKVLVLPVYFLIQFPKSTECHLQSMTPKQIRDKQLVPYINMFVINVFYSSSETLSKLFLHLAVTYNKLFPFYLAVSHFLPSFTLVFLSVSQPVALSSEHFQVAFCLTPSHSERLFTIFSSPFWYPIALHTRNFLNLILHQGSVNLVIHCAT